MSGPLDRPALPALPRRAFLQALGALGVAGGALGGLALGPSPAWGKTATKVQGVERSGLGVTLRLSLKNAPFPCEGAPYDDPTVMVFVPAYYRAEGDEVDAVVHFHGHGTTADRALAVHRLREQLHDSRQNAILVVPQGPVNAGDSHAGKLEKQGGLRKLLAEAAVTLASPKARAALGTSATPAKPRLGLVCLSAHSGGYKAAASCLRRAGCEVGEVYLFDALYGEVEAFRAWVTAAKGRGGRERHKLVSVSTGGDVRRLNLELERDLEKAGVRCLHERKPGELTRKELRGGRAIFLDAPAAHTEVMHAHGAFRDCLLASGLRRYLKADWPGRRDG